MTYFDGFVIAVPSDKKDEFVRHAETIDPMFLELGALLGRHIVSDGDLPPCSHHLAADHLTSHACMQHLLNQRQ